MLHRISGADVTQKIFNGRGKAAIPTLALVTAFPESCHVGNNYTSQDFSLKFGLCSCFQHDNPKETRGKKPKLELLGEKGEIGASTNV